MINGLTTKLSSHAFQVVKEIEKGEKAKRAKAAALVMPRLKAAAPKVSGNLRSSIKKQEWKRSTGVGFTRPKGSHAWLVENPHDIVRNGVKVGRTKGNPFFRNTWNQALPEMIKILQESPI
jgi:hypothetical protein